MKTVRSSNTLRLLIALMSMLVACKAPQPQPTGIPPTATAQVNPPVTVPAPTVVPTPTVVEPTPTTSPCPYTVTGDILGQWDELQREKGPLGCPTMNQSPTADQKGQFANFQHGAIYWSEATGAHVVSGDILTEWDRNGRESGPLGYPAATQSNTLPKVSGVGLFQLFQHGAIYSSPANGVHALWGDIFAKWDQYGRDNGTLGFPVTSQSSTLDTKGQFVNFVNGAVYWSEATGAHEVEGVIYGRWDQLKRENGRLGYPISDEHDMNGLRVSDFAHGSLTLNPGTRLVSATYLDPQGVELLNFILAMPEIDTQPDVDKPVDESKPPITTYEGDKINTRTPFQTTLTVNELAAFNPNVGIQWPGALIQGATLKEGSLADINVDRAPGTLVLSTVGDPSRNERTLPRSITVDHPSAATVEQARATLINQGFTTPAKMAEQVKVFYSLDEAMTEMGVNAKYMSSSLKAQLNSKSYESQSNVYVYFTQEYYTLAMESPSSPISYFGDSVTVDDLRPYANTADNPITYVQSVTYGRIGLLMISSQAFSQELQRAVEAHVSYLKTNVDANYSDEQKKIVSGSEIRLFLLGGPITNQQVLTGDEALKTLFTWINSPPGSDPDSIRLGVPISTRVNYLRNNQVARISLTTNYTKLDSTPRPNYNNLAIEFTTTEDKDWDTTLVIEVYNGDDLIASHEERGETFPVGFRSIPLKRENPLYLDQVTNIRVHITILPIGNDTWIFGYKVKADKLPSGGRKILADWPEVKLDQKKDCKRYDVCYEWWH